MQQQQLLNREFKIVFQPKVKSLGAVVKRVRIGVGVHSLKNYIGEHNAAVAFEQAISEITAGKTKKAKLMRARVKFRKFSIVDFYMQ